MALALCVRDAGADEEQTSVGWIPNAFPGAGPEERLAAKVRVTQGSGSHKGQGSTRVWV